MVRRILFFMAAMFVSFPVMVDALASDVSAPAADDTVPKFVAQNIVMPSTQAAMDLCEYEHALSSPGWIVKMPVHIRGVTDDQNMARCVSGRWLPAARVHLDGDGQH
jgi:hypothetical protein